MDGDNAAFLLVAALFFGLGAIAGACAFAVAAGL